MSQTIDVNGQSINYPETGDTNWGDEATEFAIQTSAALGKLGLASGTSVDIAQTLDVTGNTTLDANLSVGGNASVTGNTTLDANLSVGGDASITGNTTLTGNITVNTNKFNVTASSGNTTIAGTLGVSGNTTIDGVTYLDDDTTANTPVLSFTGDTNTGIGRSAADTLDFITNGNSRFRIESTGQLQAVISGNATFYPGYLCRAWVNFNGTGTTGQNQTIRGSGNVSSVIKNATGDYTINIDVDMPDANYATYITGRNQGSAAGNNVTLGYYSTDSTTTSQYNAGSVRITAKVSAQSSFGDLDYISLGIFR